MDKRAAEFLIVVARSESLRAAADTLGVSQPTLTKAMRRLEDEIGAPVLHRTSRGVSLTVYGEAVLRHAHAIQASVLEAQEEVAALKQGLGGRVRIGAGPSWQRSVLPEAVEMFRQEWPRVRLEVFGGMDDRLKALLRAGELDIVLAAMPGPVPVEPDLVGDALIEDEYGIIARTTHHAPAGLCQGADPARCAGGPELDPARPRLYAGAASRRDFPGARPAAAGPDCRDGHRAPQDAADAAFGLCVLPRPQPASGERSGTDRPH